MTLMSFSQLALSALAIFLKLYLNNFSEQQFCLDLHVIHSNKFLYSLYVVLVSLILFFRYFSQNFCFLLEDLAIFFLSKGCEDSWFLSVFLLLGKNYHKLKCFKKMFICLLSSAQSISRSPCLNDLMAFQGVSQALFNDVIHYFPSSFEFPNQAQVCFGRITHKKNVD